MVTVKPSSKVTRGNTKSQEALDKLLQNLRQNGCHGLLEPYFNQRRYVVMLSRCSGDMIPIGHLPRGTLFPATRPIGRWTIILDVTLLETLVIPKPSTFEKQLKTHS